MMFHRESGGLKEELREMKDCMPHYYRITDGHGQGAELVMEAEGKFLQGDFLDAQIGLENAYARIAGNGRKILLYAVIFWHTGCLFLQI